MDDTKEKILQIVDTFESQDKTAFIADLLDLLPDDLIDEVAKLLGK